MAQRVARLEPARRKVLMLEEEKITDAARKRRSQRKGGPNARNGSPVTDAIQLGARDAGARRDLRIGEPPPVCEPREVVGELARLAGHGPHIGSASPLVKVN